MVDIINPQLGELILDPACGTGVFLTCSLHPYPKGYKSYSKTKPIFAKSLQMELIKPLNILKVEEYFCLLKIYSHFK